MRRISCYMGSFLILILFSWCSMLYILSYLRALYRTASDNHLIESERLETQVQLELLSRYSVLSRAREVDLVMPKRHPGVFNFTTLPKNFSCNVKPHKPAKRFTIRFAKFHSSQKSSSDKPQQLEKTNSSFFVLFLVKSSCLFGARRNWVRKTWGAITEVNGKRFAAVFLIGVCPDERSQAAVQAESDEFGDILQSDVPDGYRDLADKVLSGYQWVYYHSEVTSDFFASTDDDCVINLALIYDYFLSNQEKFKAQPAMHCGFRYNEYERPVRGSTKYSVSKSVYPLDVFPPFCHGGLSVMPRAHLRAIYREAEITRRAGFHLEDVYINGILRSRLGKGSPTIRRTYLESVERHVPLYLGTFVWHVGYGTDTAANFDFAWRAAFNLMTAKVNKTIFVGFWPSADYFLAEARPHLAIPPRVESGNSLTTTSTFTKLPRAAESF